MRNQAVPNELYRLFERANQLRRTDDLVGSIIDTQIEFGNQGFQFYIKDKKSKSRFEPLIDRFNLYGLHEQLWNSLCTYSNAVLHWKTTSTGVLEYVSVLNPYDIEVIPGLNNQSLVYLKVPDLVIKLANAPMLLPEEKQILNSFPAKYIQAAKRSARTSMLCNRDNMVLLSNNDGEYWLIANLDGFTDRLIQPRMKQIFDSIENRNLLIDGDFSVAFLIKSFIMQVKAGEPIAQGPKAGSRQNWATDKHLKALQKHFKTSGRAMWFFTDHTTEILQHFPDVKIFDPIKYVSPENRILMWGGVGRVLMLGEGSNYAAGFINLKRLIAKVKKYREALSGLWESFFSHPTIMGGISTEKLPIQIYDDSLLKEASLDLQEKQFLVDRGGLSIQSALIKSGYDPDIEEQNKQEELDKEELYLPKLTSMMPISVAMQKQQQQVQQTQQNVGTPAKDKKKKGRPANTIPSHGETTVTKHQNPRPSKGTK